MKIEGEVVRVWVINSMTIIQPGTCRWDRWTGNGGLGAQRLCIHEPYN